jgi:hypothetical protein
MTDYVDPDDIADEVGDVLQGNATLVVPMITTMAKAYTRGHGFVGNQPNDEIAAAITTAAARFISNPSQISRNQTAGPFSEDMRGGFNGWTLAEQIVLNRYPVRAM